MLSPPVSKSYLFVLIEKMARIVVNLDGECEN
jgi:hypothetical protein